MAVLLRTSARFSGRTAFKNHPSVFLILSYIFTYLDLVTLSDAFCTENQFVSNEFCALQAACDVAWEYAHQRKQFGEPIGHFQLIQGKMADMVSNVTTVCGSSRFFHCRSCAPGSLASPLSRVAKTWLIEHA